MARLPPRNPAVHTGPGVRCKDCPKCKTKPPKKPTKEKPKS